jgi:hypothetical protein
MPLLNGDFQFESAKALEHFYKRLQCLMTLLIEPAVREKLVDCVLLASELHHFQSLEQLLGNQQFAVVSMMQTNLLPFPLDFLHAVVISPVQVRQFAQ